MRKFGAVGALRLGFFFQAEDGIRDLTVTGVQTCALPISRVLAPGGGLGFLTHNRTIVGFLQVVWDEEYVQHTMPEGFHDFARFITPAELKIGRASCRERV